MKTFDKKDVFTIVTAEEAIAYIGKRGYFGDSFKELESNINKDCGDNLGEVCTDRYTSIVFRPYTCETSYGLFIPTDKVKEVEEPKKYRPFVSYEEFRLYFAIGDVIRIITIEEGEKLEWQTVMYVGVTKNINGTFIQLGANSYSLQYLFSHFKYARTQDGSNVDKEWQPFGVEE